MDEENNVVVLTNVYGDVCIRQARRKRQKLLIKELFLDYANNTTLHGLPYVSRRGLTIVEKIFWLLTFIASVILCGYYISSVWLKWKNSPVLVTVSERLVPVSEVEFPSITICPQTKCMSNQYKFTEEFDKFEHNRFDYMSGNLNDSMKKDMEKYEDVSLVCDPEREYTNDFKAEHPRKRSDSSIIDNIFMAAPNQSNVFQQFYKIRGRYQEISGSVIKTFLTSEGVCYNINSRPADQIFRSDSLPHIKNTDKAEKPYYAKDASHFPDMIFFLYEDKSVKDQMCNSLNSGFRVYVQHPDDLPQASLHYYAVLNDQASAMALSFSMLSTSEAVEHYDPQTRQCYLPNERYLQHFQIYTTNNCKIECLANVTLRRCDCVGFYMPRLNNTPICTMQSTECMFEAAEKLVDQESNLKTAKCQCLPPCQSVEYEAEILKTEYSLKTFEQVYADLLARDLNVTLDLPETTVHYSKLEIYFKKAHFISMRRSEMFGMIDFLANCGGLLGLFLGFSFLSLVELVYFVTLRLLCTLKKDLEEEKAQTVQVVEVEDDIDKIKY